VKAEKGEALFNSLILTGVIDGEGKFQIVSDAINENQI